MTISQKDVVDGILSGINSANTSFEKWSKGAWIPDYAIEGFMVAHIAAALRKRQHEHESLLIEAPFEEIRECSEASRTPGRRRRVLEGRRRADIALFDGKDRSVYVIEAKRTWNRKPCFRDVKRLLALLHECARQRDGTLKAGFLCLTIVEWGTNRREVEHWASERMRQIHEDIREQFKIDGRKMTSKPGRKRWYPKKYCGNEEWVAVPFCIKFLPGQH